MADTVGEINGALDSILENCAKLDARIDALKVKTSARHDYITESGGKFTVHAESGKHMGTYSSKGEAEKRLREIEYFKHKD